MRRGPSLRHVLPILGSGIRQHFMLSLAVRGPDQPPVPKERLVRPHAKVFADPPQTEGTNLVDRSRLLDPFVDADDIDWKDNPFERAEQFGKTNYWP